MTRCPLQFVCFALLLGGCDTKDDGEAKPTATPKVAEANVPDPVPDAVPEPTPDPAPRLAVVSIASVQMMQDCPDADPAPAAESPMPASVAKPMPGVVARRRPGSGPGAGRSMRQPCTQSMVHLAFTGQGPASATVRIKEISLFPAKGGAASGGELGSLASRGPTMFIEGAYKPWDEMLAPDSDLKAAYKLSLPNWSEVESRNGKKSSFGSMFVLEIEVEVDGVVQTVRSPEFTRERPHVMVT